MKKNILLTILITFIAVTLNVNADNFVAPEGNSKFNSLKTEYNKGIQKTNINGTGTVTLYGYSSCDSSGCTYKYSNTSSDFKEVLKKSVTCTGGEKYIIYQTTGGADGYKTSNSANYTGEAYWSEDYQVSCTSNSSGSSVINLNNDSSTTTTNSSNNGTTNGSEYNSSSTVKQEQTGVTTYFVVLGLVALISGIFMICVKKYNLFQ